MSSNFREITVIGNITDDPKLVVTGSGAEVVNFSIASTPRRRDAESGDFKDGKTLYYRSAVWRRDAKNFAAGAVKGDRVIATGELVPNDYEKDGVMITGGFEFVVSEIGLSSAFAEVTAKRNPKGGGNSAPSSTPAAAAAPAAAAPVAAAAAPAAAPALDDDFS